MARLLDNERYSKYYQRLAVVYQTPEVKASLEVILSVFMVSVLIFAAIRPTLTNIASLQKKIDDQEALDSKADKKIAQLFSARAQLDDYQGKLSLFDQAVGEKVSFFDPAARIESLATKNNLIIDSLALPGSGVWGSGKAVGDWAGKLIKKESDGSMTSEVNLVVYGLPADVRKFLIDVENMDKLTMIKNVVFLKETGQLKGSGRLKVSIQIQFYFYANLP